MNEEQGMGCFLCAGAEAETDEQVEQYYRGNEEMEVLNGTELDSQLYSQERL
jgi:hypothetical protein